MIWRRYRILWVAFIFLNLVRFADGQNSEIRILYLNDFHGFAEPYRQFGLKEFLGGLATLATP